MALVKMGVCYVCKEMVDLNRHTHVAQQSTDADQLTTLIREVAAWRKAFPACRVYETSYSPHTARAVMATNMHPDLQARIAREMKSK